MFFLPLPLLLPYPTHHQQVPDVDNSHFWELMDKMVEINSKLAAMGNGTSTIPALMQPLAKVALYERMASLLLRVLAMKPIQCGSFDLADNQAELLY